MILFDTASFGEPKLAKFEGGMDDLNPSQGTYKSFNKAKSIVVNGLKKQIKEIEEDLKLVEGIMDQDDLDFSENPFTGYLRSLHGDLK